MRFDNPFDVAELPKSENDYSLIPDGWYSAVIKTAEIKSAKSGGKYISVRFNITGDKQAGRGVFANINIRNPNMEAEKIGLQQLGDVVRSVGIIGKLMDTDQLIGGQLNIKVATRKSEKYGEQNEVKGYKPLMKMPLTAESVPEELKSASAPKSSSVPPWAAK